MIRQYYTSPFQGGDNPLRIGTVATGNIFHLPSGPIPAGRMVQPTRPWIVEGFLNGLYTAAGRDPRTGKWFNRVISGRSDLAILRCLSDGRRQTLAVRVLRHCAELGSEDPENRPPALPDLARCYGRRRRATV
ncbi:hypothetical protein [Kozakia baliensis]|uniref:hypothetical protein n=1 Tax=Kozakia baliensis TaxID=153496 RepID=UPI00087C2D31|nr:hypothetical protein [Kozakia baliensis]AOX21611.1 hypothetical protein A0U90_13990 [Kozakia baliensis]